MGYWRGDKHVRCWNQGLTGQIRTLQPGQFGHEFGVTVIADPMGGLHVLDGVRDVAYAGVDTVDGPEGLARVSSRVSNFG